MVNDTISDMLTRIRNACLMKKATVLIPFTKMNQKITQILEKEGFIHGFQMIQVDSFPTILVKLKYRAKKTQQGKSKEACITNLKRISKPGLRIYSNHKDIPRILGGAGIVILSTPDGILTDREARALGIGGEIVCSIW